MKIKISTKFNRLGAVALMIIFVLYMMYKIAIAILPTTVCVSFMVLFGAILLALIAHTIEILEE